MNVILIGYRGSGKTSVGRLLAEKLGLRFVDTDVLIVERAGKTIKEIFAGEGEAGFRDRESAVISDVCKQDGQVIASGGGAILRPQNVTAMEAAGTIVWLEADAETLFARINADAGTTANRPNLTSTGGLEEVRHILAHRTPIYEAAADLAINVAKLSPTEIVAKIAADLT